MIEDMGDVSHSVGIKNWFIIAARGQSYNWVLTVIEPLVTLVNSSDFDHKGYSSYYQFIHSAYTTIDELFGLQTPINIYHIKTNILSTAYLTTISI